MSKLAATTILAIALFSPAGGEHARPQVSSVQPAPAWTLEGKLRAIVLNFDAGHRPMVDEVLTLAYKYQLPLGLENLTSDAVQKPLDLRVRRSSLGDVITALTGSVPGYRVDFAHGLVEVYSPKARLDASNPFNLVVPEYRVASLDTEMASAMLLCALGTELHPQSAGCGGSSALGQWGPLKITLEIRNARVREILNAIVAQNGRAIWTPISLPTVRELRQGRSLTNFWYIYPLDGPFESAAAERLRGLFLPAAQADKR
jgi:hypothetical protein